MMYVSRLLFYTIQREQIFFQFLRVWPGKINKEIFPFHRRDKLHRIIKFTTRGYKICAHVLEIISTLQRAKTTDSRINPGRVQHEALARRGINSVTQNSRRIVGNLTLETFELSKADPSASHALLFSDEFLRRWSICRENFLPVDDSSVSRLDGTISWNVILQIGRREGNRPKGERYASTLRFVVSGI